MKSIVTQQKQPFAPIKLEITIESEQELIDLHLRIRNGSCLEGAPKGLYELAQSLYNVAENRGIEVFKTPYGPRLSCDYPPRPKGDV